MELRNDLLYSIPQYGGQSRGLRTLGESKIITKEDGKKIELLPYLVEMGYTRGVSKEDPRRRRSHENAIKLIAEAYANHYNQAGINEQWTKEEVENMLNWLLGQSAGRFFFVKWARDVVTNEEFPVGFVTAYAKPFQGGNMLWDGEIFVLPEYQRYGLGTELTKVLLLAAQKVGINLFEALTYEDEKGYPLKLWEKYGATKSDLIHIYGEINEMLTQIDHVETEKQGRKL